MSSISTYKPLPHQKEGIIQIETCKGRVLLADDMGVGKTFQVLACLKRNPHWLPAIIVCPANVKYKWEHEAQLFFGLRASICEGKTPPTFNRKSGFNIHSPLTIINPDILPSWVDYFIESGYSTIALDECHMFADRASKRTKAAQVLAERASHVIGMSGTPIMNRPIDIWPVLNMIWPKVFRSYWGFAQKYCNPKWIHGRWDFSGASNLNELNEKLVELGMIRRKKDILHLPEKTISVIPVELRNPHEYYEASTDFMGWLQKTHADKVRKVKKSERMARVGYLLRLGAKLKLQSCVARINHLLEVHPDQKIVVMGVHQKALRVLEDKIKCQHITIDGNVSGRDRQFAVDKFQHDPQTRVCIANIKAAGVGINLTAAQRLIFLEFWWNPATHNQAGDRIHRIGQTKPTFIEYLVAKGTLEEKLCKLLQDRQKISNAVIDGGDAGIEEFNLYEALLETLEKRLL